ncbi:15985_t:CDS:10, partial [Entrophospora sp. SA101]
MSSNYSRQYQNMQQHATNSPAIATIVRKRNNPDPNNLLNLQQQQTKKKRTIDRNMPEKLDNLVPESRLYTELQDFERRLDATIIRKPQTQLQSEGGEGVEGAVDVNSNVNYGDSSNIPAWTLKIEGRLLDPSNSNSTSKTNKPSWNKPLNFEDVDGFEIKRKGDVNVRAKIYFNLDLDPQKFKLSPELAELLDVQEESKSGVIMILWQYIKIFNCQRMAFPQIPDSLNRHLFPIEPICIEYTICTDKEYNQSHYAYDIQVEIDDPNKIRLAAIASNTLNQKEVQSIDEKIVQCIQSINNSKAKRDFLLNFANSPIEFINKWIASQSRDLEEQRYSEFYKQDWVNEATFHYISAQTQKRMQELLGNSGG